MVRRMSHHTSRVGSVRLDSRQHLYGGDHIDFSQGTFHGPITGKKVDRSDTDSPSNKEPDTEPDR